MANPHAQESNRGDRALLFCLMLFGSPVLGSAAEPEPGITEPLVPGSTLSADAFQNPPNEFRLTQYGLNKNTLRSYPRYGIGAFTAFFYRQLERGTPGNIGQLVDAAGKIDFKVWLADDYGYPSGMAGGKVVEENPDWEVRGLTMLTQKGQGAGEITFELPADLEKIVHAALYPLKDGVLDRKHTQTVSTQDRSLRTPGIEGSWQLCVFAHYIRNKDTQAQSTMKEFGHSGRYPDLMNQDAVKSFLSHIHEPILTQISDPQAKVEGFYTNEPNLMQTHWTRDHDAPYACLPWTAALPDHFRQSHGYDLMPELPALFAGDDLESRRHRLHFRQSVAELFSTSFARQIRLWCESRGIKSSGHFLLNQLLSMHVQGYGDLMKFVSEFDVPALDIGIPMEKDFASFPYQQTRLFSSVAAWKEEPEVIILLDPIIGAGTGRTRLSPPMPQLLNSVNMGFFHGANQFTSYLPLYSNRRGTATGYTPKAYQALNDYIGRSSMILKGAKRAATVALYYPIASFQADLLPSAEFWQSIDRLHPKKQGAWNSVEKTLLDEGIEYMIVHPEGVADADLRQGKLEIGSGTYDYLIMPPMDLIPLAVLQKLDAFKKAGGKVLWIDKKPQYAERGENDEAVRHLLESDAITSIDQLDALIEKPCDPSFRFRFTSEEKFLVSRFLREKQQIYYLVNRSDKAANLQVASDSGNGGTQSIKVLDPTSGETRNFPLPAKLKIDVNRSLLLLPDMMPAAGGK